MVCLQVDELNATRLRLSADIADQSNAVKVCTSYYRMSSAGVIILR